ncbi:hypothetical protein SapgrDRAFT_2932 [Saprospira grandis DSM 2844]|uniref:DUF7793 domain-containing protein n=2 Tax=Saprospira TaxID=1007 RepID=J0XZF6_9BACT|nr:hypothetical protein SapgrDRAFT_2932 [Saprospira grandis DSM 2844]
MDEQTGILVQRLGQGAYLEAEDSLEWIEAAYQIRGSQPLYFLADMRGLRGQSKEARRISGERDPRLNIAAGAGLINNGASKILGNFMLSLNKISHPIRLFTNEREAVKWLLEIREKKGH